MKTLAFTVAPLALLPGAVAVRAQTKALPWSLQQLAGDPQGLAISGTMRLRYEAMDGQFRPGFDKRDDIVSLRTTILAEYRNGPLRIGAEMYDSRSRDTDPGSVLTTGEVNTLEFVQAYIGADFRGALGPGSNASVQVGRFMLNLGSRRLVAADDYRNTTNGYTGVRADMKTADGTAATLIYTLPQIRLPDDLPSLRNNKARFDRESFDLQLWGGLVSRPRTIGKAMAEVGYFRLLERDAPGRPTRNRNLHSASARVIRDPEAGRFDYEAEAIYQFGTVRSGPGDNTGLLDVSAWFLHLDMGYSFPGAWKPRLSVEYDLATGDGTGQRYSRFDTLFGMRRADLAPSGIYAALGRTNISTPGLRMEASPNAKLDGFAVYRPLWAASGTDAFSTTGIRDASGKVGRFAGHQIEARVRYWLVPKRLRAEANGVLLLKRGLLRDAPNAPAFGDTRYISVGVTASF